MSLSATHSEFQHLSFFVSFMQILAYSNQYTFIFNVKVNFDVFRFSVGTAYGFVVFDYAQRKAILSHCTIIAAG